MRPIDADAIPYTKIYKQNWLKGTGEEVQGVWKSEIDKMPTLDSEVRKQAHFTKTWFDRYVECSECHVWYQKSKYVKPNYCSNCGAKFEERWSDE